MILCCYNSCVVVVVVVVCSNNDNICVVVLSLFNLLRTWLVPSLSLAVVSLRHSVITNDFATEETHTEVHPEVRERTETSLELEKEGSPSSVSSQDLPVVSQWEQHSVWSILWMCLLLLFLLLLLLCVCVYGILMHSPSLTYLPLLLLPPFTAAGGPTLSSNVSYSRGAQWRGRHHQQWRLGA